MSETLSYRSEDIGKASNQRPHETSRRFEYRLKEQMRPVSRDFGWRAANHYRSFRCRRGSQPSCLILRKQIAWKAISKNARRKHSYLEGKALSERTDRFTTKSDCDYEETTDSDKSTHGTTWATTQDGSDLGMGIFCPSLKPSVNSLVPEIREYLVNLDSAAEAFQMESSTVSKIVSEILVPSSGVPFARDARDLLIECCVEFITLISSEANEISEKEAKKTIACEHITKALEHLGFGEYVADILAVASEHKELLKGRDKRTNKLESSKLSTEQMLALQEAEFREAAERHR